MDSSERVRPHSADGAADPDLLVRLHHGLLNTVSINEDRGRLNRLAPDMEAIRPEPGMPLGHLGVVAQHIALRRLPKQQRLGSNGKAFAAIRSGDAGEKDRVRRRRGIGGRRAAVRILVGHSSSRRGSGSWG